MNPSLKKELMEILACPKCKAPVRQDDAAVQCTNPACRLRYPVRNGIPVMLIDQATVSPPPTGT